MKTIHGLLLLLLALPAMASDHANLAEGLPTELEDAYPVAYRGREVQTHLSYEHMDNGTDRVTLQPQVEFGFAPNAQGKIVSPFYLGDGDKKEQRQHRP